MCCGGVRCSSRQCFLRDQRDAFATVPLASAASGFLFFACPKKSNQKKGHPGVPVAGHPVRRLRERVTGFVDGTSCADNERACVRACSSRIPAGRFLFLTPGILPSALRASFAVRAAPAAQCLSEEKEPKERTPRQRRPPGILPCGCVNVGRGSPTAPPAPTANALTSCARPCGLIRPPFTAAEGGPKSSALLRAEAQTKSIAAEAAPTTAGRVGRSGSWRIAFRDVLRPRVRPLRVDDAAVSADAVGLAAARLRPTLRASLAGAASAAMRAEGPRENGRSLSPWAACAATAPARSVPTRARPCRARAAGRCGGRTGSATRCLRVRSFR